MARWGLLITTLVLGLLLALLVLGVVALMNLFLLGWAREEIDATARSRAEASADLLASARRAIVDSSSWSEQAFDDAVGAIEEWGRRPDAAIWYGTFWAEGVRRAPGRCQL